MAGHVNKVVWLQRTTLRIALHSLGSPLWLEEGARGSESGYPPTLPRFLHSLRGMLRQAYASALITMPTHLFQVWLLYTGSRHNHGCRIPFLSPSLLKDAAFVRRLERLCDCVVRLESFAGSVKEQNPVYKEYHGSHCCGVHSFLLSSQQSLSRYCVQAYFMWSSCPVLTLSLVIIRKLLTWRSNWKGRSFL